MSSEARLCKEVLLEEFGPFVSAVGYQLLLKGRLALPDLVRFSELSQRQVRECLVVMIQHGLCYFSEAVDGKIEPTYYTADAKKIAMRLRIGAILRHVEERYGKEAQLVCKALLVRGRLTLKGFKKWVKDHEKKTKLEPYEKAFTILAHQQYIRAVLPEHSRSTMDRFLAATEKETEKYTIMTAKDLQTAKLQAKAQIDAEYGDMETVGMKRKAIDPLDIHAKRPHIEGLPDDEEIEIDEKIFFSINYDRFNVVFRNDVVVDFATERINRSAGEIVKGFFEHGKDKIKDTKEDESPSATPIHIANKVSTDLVTRGDIVLPTDPFEPNKKPSLQDVVKAYIILLKTDTAGFVKSKDERGANQYAVNFEKLRISMKRRLMEGLVRERYGVATCRIMRILIEKGKLDESQVQKLAMLPPKDTREKLALLKTKGFVEIQEIPRSADRAPGRCFHLWYVPIEKCFEELLIDCYRAIINLSQRKEQELKTRKRLLDKLNRKDVKENPELLGEAEREELKNTEKLVERLEVSKSRIDTMVMIMRDF